MTTAATTQSPLTTGRPQLTPALYPTRVAHLHRFPVHHYGEHRSYSWLVDVDDLPQLPGWLRPFARFEAADHFHGGPSETLRQRVDAVLAAHGISLDGGRITALLMPRVLGRSFNPLSLFWCHDRDGALRCVVAEVQTARGHRHAYVLPPSGGESAVIAPPLAGRSADSPFAGGEGHFLVSAPHPGESLDLRISLHRDNHAAMVATWRGQRRPATIRQILLMQITTPLAPHFAELTMRFQATMLRIRRIRQSTRPTTGQPVRSPAHAGGSGWTPAGRSLAAS